MSKAKVISVLNHKGGVGKTTTTINLGGALRQKGYKVLLIDLDGQANLTESLGFSAELPQTIYGAMKGEYDLRSTSIRTVLASFPPAWISRPLKRS